MKILKYSLMGILCMMLFASCDDNYFMSTVINADGSCYREFEAANVKETFFAKDSMEKYNPFPVTIDSNWVVTWKYGDGEWQTELPLSKEQIAKLRASTKDSVSIDKDSSLFSVKIRRDYKKVALMNDAFSFTKEPWRSVKINFDLNKKFRWFYTYYEYKETYHKADYTFKFPIDKYMSKDEYMYWFTGKPNLTQTLTGFEAREFLGKLEDKYFLWFNRNLWHEEYKSIVDSYDKLQPQPVSKERFIALEDTIFNKQMAGKTNFEMGEELNKYFKTTLSPALLTRPDSSYFNEESTYLPFYMGANVDAIDYRLAMPGKIIYSNSTTTDNNILIWNLSASRFLVSAYSIEATSEKANSWAFIFTGVIALIAVGSLIIGKKPKSL